MKTLKTLFLTLIMAIGFASTASATKDTLVYSFGTTVINGVPHTSSSASLTVNVGDTLVFQSLIGGSVNYMVDTISFTISYSQYFQYKVVASDVPNFIVTATAFSMTQTVVTVYVNGITTGVAENTNKIQFNSFPNPVTDELTINATSNLGKVSVVSLTGQVVFNETINEPTTKVDFTTFAPGTYVVIVGNTTRKIIKQ